MNYDTILLVDDNSSIQFNIGLMLKLNNFLVLKANNGKEAIEILKESKNYPDLIISDILMPEIDGYEFLEKISSNPNWNTIPFIFLSAKATPDDIKLGKLLGADDYLTKPVDEELLIGLIRKKIHKIRELESNLKNRLELDFYQEIKQVLNPSIVKFDKTSIFLFIVEWDEKIGPKLTKKMFENSSFNIDLESLGIQLFQTIVSLFGQQEIISPEAVLLNVINIQMKAMILFDAITDSSVRGNQRQIMISVIAPEINYLDSLRLKNTLLNISSEIKKNQKSDLECYYGEIQSILVKSE